MRIRLSAKRRDMANGCTTVVLIRTSWLFPADLRISILYEFSRRHVDKRRPSNVRDPVHPDMTFFSVGLRRLGMDRIRNVHWMLSRREATSSVLGAESVSPGHI
jgi:hypothetical protein